MADLYGNPSAPPTTGGLTDNVAGGLAYITIIPAIIFLLLAPYNRREFVRFHCFQSLLIFAVQVVLGFLRALLFPILGMVGAALIGLLSFVVFILLIVALVQAFRGFKFLTPGIGPIAQGMAVK